MCSLCFFHNFWGPGFYGHENVATFSSAEFLLSRRSPNSVRLLLPGCTSLLVVRRTLPLRAMCQPPLSVTSITGVNARLPHKAVIHALHRSPKLGWMGSRPPLHPCLGLNMLRFTRRTVSHWYTGQVSCPGVGPTGRPGTARRSGANHSWPACSAERPFTG